MNERCDFNICQATIVLFNAVILWLVIAGNVMAEEPASIAQVIRFERFELELPKGLISKDFLQPGDNPISKEKVELGHTLFFDSRLSIDNSLACASCHSPRAAFADSLPVSLGVNGQPGERNAPTIINRAFSSRQFWDGRAESLEEQSKEPLTNPKEMAMPSHDFLINKLRKINGYRNWFKRAFNREININDLARAIAAFERTVVSGNSRFDTFKSGNQKALSESERRGLTLFEGKARCSQCHNGPNFTDEKFHNLGVDWDTTNIDLGRFKFSNNEQHIGAFKTPTLREVAHTAPYMHNGTFATLEETVEFYNNGGIANPFLDIEMRRTNRTLEQILDFYEKEKQPEKGQTQEIGRVALNLTKQEQADLVAFLKALSGQGWQQIIAPDSFPE